MTIQIGQPAPDFQADAWIRGAHGPRKVTLSEYRGKWVVLFFYPRDFTFICPTEIASFGALQPSFERSHWRQHRQFLYSQSLVRVGP